MCKVGTGMTAAGAASTVDAGADAVRVGVACTIASVVAGAGTRVRVVSGARSAVRGAAAGFDDGVGVDAAGAAATGVAAAGVAGVTALTALGADRAVTAATRFSVRTSAIEVVAVSPPASTAVATKAAESVADCDTSRVRGAGSCVATMTVAPSTTSATSETPTPRMAVVEVDVSSVLSAGLPGRMSGVRLTGRKGVTGASHCAQTSSSSPMTLLQEGQEVEGTVMPGGERRNGK